MSENGGVHDPQDREIVERRILRAIQSAIHLDEMNETEMAVKELLPLVVEYPDEPGVRIYLGWFLRRCGRFPESIEHSSRGVELLPRSSRASLVLFQALSDGGSRPEAICEIRRFLPIRRSNKDTPHYDEILRKWDAADREGIQPRTTKRVIGNA